MEIYYENERLKKILESKKLIKKFYPDDFKKILERMDEMKGALNLSLISHLPPPRRHKLVGEYKDCWAVSISKNKRIVFRAMDSSIIQIELIKEIVIIGIINYH